MPLKAGTSHAAMSYNYRLERKHGKSSSQSKAIMLHKAGIKKRRAHRKRTRRKRNV